MKRKQKQSQDQRVLKYLESGKELTPLLALKKGMGMRLSARIYNLRKRGYNIKTDKSKGYASYKLVTPMPEYNFWNSFSYLFTGK